MSITLEPHGHPMDLAVILIPTCLTWKLRFQAVKGKLEQQSGGIMGTVSWHPSVSTEKKFMNMCLFLRNMFLYVYMTPFYKKNKSGQGQSVLFM